uniref:Uncharacterized protein n=1 Tax=Mimivirus LCMiAC01 TaxID=2506608 RepID=A0A481YZR8_9VIRU|nr:MAG: hypothetical protein LCMiAC01_03370 [Mimivirus LCMiAC01]
MSRKKAIWKYICDNVIVDNNDNILHDIYAKYGSELNGYKYIKNINSINDIKIGGYIKYIDLHMKNIRYGVLTNISYDLHNNKQLTLKNTRDKFYWKIISTKYYIFYKKHNPNNKNALRAMIQEYLKKMNNININDMNG